MCAPDGTVYPLVMSLLQVLLAGQHASGVRASSGLVWALLQAQSLHVADLARALPDLRARGARQAMRRVRRHLGGAALSSTVLSPLVMQAALRLVEPGAVTLILDSTRCRRWEIFTLGVRLGGRVLPVAWSVLPYPWPRQQFTPTVVGLITRTLTSWPPSRPVHLLADRGFPSRALFCCLEEWRARRSLGYTIRLRASDYVRDDTNQAHKVADLMTQRPASGWGQWSVSYQRRRPSAPGATLFIGQEQIAPPPHQRGPADTRRRAARAARRAAHLRSKSQPAAAQTDRLWALLSTHATAPAAAGAYAGRFATEGTYRDYKEWDLEAVAAHETSASHLDGLLGLAALAYLVQGAIGLGAGRAHQDAARARQDQWSTTDRLSFFWRGRHVLHDQAFNWLPWLGSCLSQVQTSWHPDHDRSPPFRSEAA
jgi:hypothetical protein